MAPKYTTAEFIARARAKHGEKYDYSATVYTGSLNRITVTCPDHGVFTPVANSHLKTGCKFCGFASSSAKQCMTTEEFVTRARKLYGDKYDYSQTVYVHSLKKLTITCPKHGDFEMEGHRHLKAGGCTKCSGGLEQVVDTASFVRRVTAMYDGMYDYSKADYKGCGEPVIVGCRTHGDFSVTPVLHIHHRVGCPMCTEAVTGGKKFLGTEGFIERARAVHGNTYNYDKVLYVNIDTKVVITCLVHGDFEQSAWSHIGQRQGCSQCNGGFKYTTATWVAKAREVHGDVFDYSKVEYASAHDKVSII